MKFVVYNTLNVNSPVYEAKSRREAEEFVNLQPRASQNWVINELQPLPLEMNLALALAVLAAVTASGLGGGAKVHAIKTLRVLTDNPSLLASKTLIEKAMAYNLEIATAAVAAGTLPSQGHTTVHEGYSY